MNFDDEFQDFVKRGCRAQKAVDQLGASRKKVAVKDVETAAKKLACLADHFNAGQVRVILSDENDVPQSMMLYIKEDPEKVRLIEDLLKAWEKSDE